MIDIKIRVSNPDGGFSDPESANYVDPQDLPRIGEPMISPEDRAFNVLNVERRYDLGQIHLFVEEFPRQKPPVAP